MFDLLVHVQDAVPDVQERVALADRLEKDNENERNALPLLASRHARRRGDIMLWKRQEFIVQNQECEWLRTKSRKSKSRKSKSTQNTD